MFESSTLWAMGAMILASVCGSLLASRASFFKKHPVRQGVLFGLLAASALFLLRKEIYLQISIDFMDFPVLSAGLFFGPVACIVSTAIVILIKIAVGICGIMHAGWWFYSCIGSLVICGYTICVSKISFNSLRPTVPSGFIAAAFGECMHLAVLFAVGTGTPAFTYRVVSDLFPAMAAGGGLTAALSALICTRENGSRRFFIQSNISFLVFGLAYILIIAVGVDVARKKVSETLRNGMRDFRQTIHEHVSFSMHRCADNIVRKIGDYSTVSRERLEELAEDHSLNEVNIIGASGRFLATSSREIQKYLGTYQSYREDMHFRRQVRNDDPKAIMQKIVRHSLQAPYEMTCFIEIPFPDKNAFLKPGYSISSFYSDFRKLFIPHISAKPIGTNGFFLIVDRAGKIIGPVHGHPDAIAQKAENIGLEPDSMFQPEDKLFKAYLFNEKTVCVRMKNVGDLNIYACLPIHEIFNPILMNIAIAGIALLGLSLILLWMLRRIDHINREEEEYVKNELLFARQIQADELQEETPDTVHYKISAAMLPAKIVGGDFYDFYTLENHKVVLSVADVSGKGMAAAIFMMKVKTALKLYSYRCGSIKEIVEAANNEICRKNRSMMFVTAFTCIFDPQTGDLEFVNAGHNPPLVIRAGGTVEGVECEKNLPLGVRLNGEYRTQKLHLNHKDRLFLCTDGVIEAKDENKGLYGRPRLRAVIEQVHSGDDLTAAVVQDVKKFIGAGEQTDDITILTILYR